MEYPVEYMTGLMIAASAFIMIAGVLLAVTPKERRKRFWISSTVFSLVLGAGVMLTTLNWFNEPSAGIKLLAMLFLAFQYVTVMYPMIVIGYSIAEKDNAVKKVR